MSNRQLTAHTEDFFDIFNLTAFGFNEMVEQINSRTYAKNGMSSFDYPPTDIIQDSKDSWTIRLAVPGRSKETLTVSLENSKLRVAGTKAFPENETTNNYINKGISGKAFERTYTLGEFVEVKDVSLLDGMLTIKLEKNIPEEKKPKQFSISTS